MRCAFLRRRKIVSGRLIEALECRLFLTTYTSATLASFPGDGVFPVAGLVKDIDGNFYGVTSGTTGGTKATIGNDGNIYEVAQGTNVITPLAWFDGTDGTAPLGLLAIDSSGNLYGTTSSGGANGDGVIFELAKGSSSITVLASFDGADGSDPVAGLVRDSSGNLFGATQTGGADGDGVVFELANGSSTITVLGSFNATNGSAPQGALVLDSSGNLWGTASAGGADSDGTVFEVTHGSTSITLIASFDGSDGSDPVAGLAFDSSHNLWGTAETGGAGDGVVFEIPQGSTIITAISFDGPDGVAPEAPVIFDSSGNLYGTTYGNDTALGPDPDGSIFEIAQGSTTITDLVTLTFTSGGGNGPDISGGLIMDAGGNLYGVGPGTNSSNDVGAGLIFELPKNSNTLTDAAWFIAPPDESIFSAPLVDGNGDVFGSTMFGGADLIGSIYEVPFGSGSIDTLYSFPGTGVDGAAPDGSMVLDSNGDLFGAGTEGGTDSHGDIFELAHGASTLTILASFDGANGSGPASAVVMDGNGDLFGSASSGGANNDGSVWELADGSSSITLLASYSIATSVTPGDIALDANGDVFGVSSKGGADSDGYIFEIVKGSGSMTTLASFDGADGKSPFGGVVLDTDGNLFGSTATGGPSNDGVVYELAHGSSTINDLAAFDGTDGNGPTGVVMDGSGNLIGYSSGAGTSGTGIGTVFEIVNGSGSITTLQTLGTTFEDADFTGVSVDSNGDVYGATNSGGPQGNGIVFELVASSANPPLSLLNPATAVSVDVGDSYQINWSGGNSTDTVQLWAEGGPDNTWTELTTGVPQTDGSYTWNTTGVLHGWYHFKAWDIPVSGTAYTSNSPNWLHIVAPAAEPPNAALLNPPFSTSTVMQGSPFILNWTATDGANDTNPISVQLWVYNGDTGQWSQLPNAGDLPASPSSYAWDTTGMLPGWYSFDIHATDGDLWNYQPSPGWVFVAPPVTPTITYLTPTSGQTTAAGGVFDLDWSIGGYSATYVDQMTLEIFEEHLVNGSPAYSVIDASIAASAGTYAWTVPSGAGTYYAFNIWLNYGDQQWGQASPNWVQAT